VMEQSDKLSARVRRRRRRNQENSSLTPPHEQNSENSDNSGPVFARMNGPWVVAISLMIAFFQSQKIALIWLDWICLIASQSLMLVWHPFLLIMVTWSNWTWTAARTLLIMEFLQSPRDVPNSPPFACPIASTSLISQLLHSPRTHLAWLPLISVGVGRSLINPFLFYFWNAEFMKSLSAVVATSQTQVLHSSLKPVAKTSKFLIWVGSPISLIAVSCSFLRVLPNWDHSQSAAPQSLINV
jgi:hypothetical protein